MTVGYEKIGEDEEVKCIKITPPNLY